MQKRGLWGPGVLAISASKRIPVTSAPSHTPRLNYALWNDVVLGVDPHRLARGPGVGWMVTCAPVLDLRVKETRSGVLESVEAEGGNIGRERGRFFSS